MSNKSLTIVLPVYNRETRLSSDVREMLELASELSNHFGVLIVDDGSTDSTFEVAEDLAMRYPQVAVRRHRHRSGLGPAIDYVHRSVRSDAVIFHDGMTPIDANQMRNVWRRWIAQFEAEDRPASSAALHLHVCDFANLPAIHAAMERAHSTALGFQLMTPSHDDQAVASAGGHTTTSVPRADAAHDSDSSGVGRIPHLPRPKFLSALADFALGE